MDRIDRDNRTLRFYAGWKGTVLLWIAASALCLNGVMATLFFLRGSRWAAEMSIPLSSAWKYWWEGPAPGRTYSTELLIVADQISSSMGCLLAALISLALVVLTAALKGTSKRLLSRLPAE